LAVPAAPRSSAEGAIPIQQGDAIRARKAAAAPAPPSIQASGGDSGQRGGAATAGTMHRLADLDTRRMPIGGPSTPGEAAGPCAKARRHAPAFFGLLAVGLVAATIMTRQGEGSGSSGGGTGLPHLTGAGGAAGVRLSNSAVDQGASGVRSFGGLIPPLIHLQNTCLSLSPLIPSTPMTDAYECIKGVDFEDFGSSFKGLARRDCAAMCNAMPNCRLWSYDASKDGGLCTTRYDNYTSFFSPEVESCVQVRFGWIVSLGVAGSTVIPLATLDLTNFCFHTFSSRTTPRESTRF